MRLPTILGSRKELRPLFSFGLGSELLLARRQREVGRVAAGLDLDFEFGFGGLRRGDELF